MVMGFITISASKKDYCPILFFIHLNIALYKIALSQPSVFPKQIIPELCFLLSEH